MEATKLQDGFYWVELPKYIRTNTGARVIVGYDPPEVANLRRGEDWWIAGSEQEFKGFVDIKILSSRLDVNDGQWKTAFEQASKSVDSAHELLDAVREIVTDYNAAQVDDHAEVFDSLEAIEMISELIL
jgi:hypothetical protein